MPEELSPGSKLYVKEEIEKVRKEVGEDLEKVKSKATRTFTTVVIVVGLLTGLGVYGLAQNYIDTAVQEKLGADTLEEIERHRIEAEMLYNNIVKYEADSRDIISSKVIIGTIVPYGGEIKEGKAGEPTKVCEGWYFCNGAVLKCEEYRGLYEVIGTAFGGVPDSNTFSLPDLRGRFVRGVDYGQKRDPDAQLRTVSNEGGNTGDKVGSLQDDALKIHSHLLGKTVYRHYRSFEGSSGQDRALKDIKVDEKDELWISNTEKSGVSNETRPKNIYVNWIIKAR